MLYYVVTTPNQLLNEKHLKYIFILLCFQAQAQAHDPPRLLWPGFLATDSNIVEMAFNLCKIFAFCTGLWAYLDDIVVERDVTLYCGNMLTRVIFYSPCLSDQ